MINILIFKLFYLYFIHVFDYEKKYAFIYVERKYVYWNEMIMHFPGYCRT